MRIIGGAARGCRLADPGKSVGIRPTSDWVREALFNMIHVEGASFLDLFSGTGAVGCEAVSRGAVRVVMVDGNRRSVLLSRKNAEKVAAVSGSSAKIEVLHSDAVKYATRHSGEGFDFIFCDPPYDWEGHQRLLEKIHSSGMLNDGGVLVLETSSKKMPECVRPVKTKIYGDTALLFCAHAGVEG